MVGHRPLKASILVRIQVPQHEQSEWCGKKSVGRFSSRTRKPLIVFWEFMKQKTEKVYRPCNGRGPSPAAKSCIVFMLESHSDLVRTQMVVGNFLYKFSRLR